MDFIKNTSRVVNALETFFKHSKAGNKRVIDQPPLDAVISSLELEKWAKQGGLEDRELQKFLDNYLQWHTRLHHPGYLGHQCAPPHYMASLAALINAFTNNVASVYEMGPTSAAIEFFLINWMLAQVGWPKMPNNSDKKNSSNYGGGVFINGGSIANLTALVVARSKVFPNTWEKGHPSHLALILPSECHYSLTKAAGIMGFGNESLYFTDTDEKGAIISDGLPFLMKKIKSEGKYPIALVANACSTSVGVYDPLDEIADFCEQEHLWMHVDGAHGASALLSEKHLQKLKGISRADSLVWDAHKLLQTPSVCAALLVKNHQHLDAGLHVGANASYLFHEKDQPGFDSLVWTLETTKPGLGEKLFFVLAALGEKGLVDYIDSRYEITSKAYDYIVNQPDFECPVVPQSNILCFKYMGNDELQLTLRKRLLEIGEFYLTSTLFKGNRYLRLVFMSKETSFSHVKRLVESIRKIVKEFK